MTTRLKFLTMAAALLLGISSTAMAIPANGTVPFNFSNVTDNAPPGALAPGTQFTIGGIAVSGDGTGTFLPATPSPACTDGADGVCSGDEATITPTAFVGDALIGLLFTWEGGGVLDRYEYTVTNQLAPIINTIAIGGNASLTSYTIFTGGMFMDQSGKFDTAPGSVVINITQSCVDGRCSDSGSATFATPPAFSTPEPATMGLSGLALVGVGIFGRRRKK